MLEIFCQFTVATSHQHPHLNTAVSNYADLLAQLGRSPAQIHARLEEILRPFGMQLGSREQNDA